MKPTELELQALRTELDEMWKLVISQIEKACEDALKYGMSMEMEFDDRALAKNGWGYRMRDYIRVFDEYKVWDTMEVAYYQGGDAFYKLFHSDNPEDNELYNYLAEIIAKRQKNK